MAAVCASRWLRAAALTGVGGSRVCGGGGGEARRLLQALRLARWLSAGPAFPPRPARSGPGEAPRGGEWKRGPDITRGPVIVPLSASRVQLPFPFGGSASLPPRAFLGCRPSPHPL